MNVYVCLAGLALSAEVEPPAPFRQAEQQALAARRAIRCGRIRMRTEAKWLEDGKWVPTIFATDTWFDGKKIRVDVVYEKSTSSEPHAHARIVECRNCPNDGDHLAWMDWPHVGVEIGRPGKDRQVMKFHKIFDPRVLGYTCSHSGSDRRLDEVIGSPDRKDHTYTEDLIDGRKIQRLGFTFTKVPTRCVAWIDALQGNNVTRIEYHERRKTGVE